MPANLGDLQPGRPSKIINEINNAIAQLLLWFRGRAASRLDR
jgi:hypothetical protein